MPAPDSPSSSDAAPDAVTVETNPQRRDPGSLLFNRYRVVRELGRGGMGVVLLAHDEVLDIPVAMKLVPEQVVQDADGISDLKKEVLRGMALTHPGIVRTYSFEHSGHHGAIVMEYVEGATLTDLKTRQPGYCFDGDEIRDWVEQICVILDYAHQEARIAHRDLKPRNVLVTREGRVKIADFGVSSSLSDTLSRISIRADGSGSPPYMSPQQAMGDRPSHLDDIYSLGATIYELLTSRPPFFRGNVLLQVVQENPPFMTERRKEFGILDKAPIASKWERVTAACLSKDPNVRPQSGRAVLELLNGSGTQEKRQNNKTILPPMEKTIRTEAPPAVRDATRSTQTESATVLPPYLTRLLNPPKQEEPSSLVPLLRRAVAVILAAAVAAGVIHVVRTHANRQTTESQSADSAPAAAQPNQSKQWTPIGGTKLQAPGGLDAPPTKLRRTGGPPPPPR